MAIFNQHSNSKENSEGDYKKVELVVATSEFKGLNGKAIGKSHISAKILEDELLFHGPEELLKYRTISFKDNGLNEIPNFIWEMSNLTELELTNNNLKTLPVKKIKALQKLEILKLDSFKINKKSLIDFQKEYPNIIIEIN